MIVRQEAEAQFDAVKTSKFGGTLMIAETSQEGGDYAEALNYYNKVIEQEPSFADAWLNKGTCIVRTSKIGDIKAPEAISSWKAAIKFAKNPDAMKKRVALEINSVVVDFYPVLENHYQKFRDTEDAIEEHMQRFLVLEKALSLALDYYPTSRTIAENGVALCDRVVQSIMDSASARYSESIAQIRDGDLKLSNATAAAARATGNVAVSLAGDLERIKDKYRQALFRIDPALRKVAEEVAEQAEKEKQLSDGWIKDAAAAISAGQSKANRGNLVLVLFVSLAGLFGFVFLVGLSTPEAQSKPLIIVGVLFSVSLVPVMFVLWRRKTLAARRDSSWKNELPNCFGSEDLILGSHPGLEGVRLRDMCVKAFNAGFANTEVADSIRTYLKSKSARQEHIDQQVKRFWSFAASGKL